MIEAHTEVPGEFPLVLEVREHRFRSDTDAASGSHDSAPGAHDYFDASLAACKSLTVTWYAKRNQIPLEGVDVVVERNDTEERKGVYGLTVKMAFRGPLDAAQKQKLFDVAGRCPIHKLMTTTEVRIDMQHVDAEAV